MDALGPFAKLQQSVNIDALLVVEPTVVLGNADDLVSGLVHQTRGVRPHIAKALHDDTDFPRTMLSFFKASSHTTRTPRPVAD